MDHDKIPSLKDVKKFKKDELLRLHPDKYKNEAPNVKEKMEEVQNKNIFISSMSY